MKHSIRLVLGAALLPLIVAFGCSDNGDATAPDALPAELDALYASLAPYTSLTLAKSAGYETAITDCMSNGDQGAMGVHWGNTAYIDGVVDEVKPEALIYEPGKNGEMSLVGVEFIVPFSAVPRESPAPQAFGRSFQVNDVFGVWALHVWTHRLNPKGTFAPWNPRVSC